MAIKPRSQVELAVEIARSSKPFDFDPGTAWLYNANHIVLGAVIEQVCKLPLAQAVKQLVFDPLGLRSTAFDAPDEVVTEARVGLRPDRPISTALCHAPYLDPSQAGGAGRCARVQAICATGITGCSVGCCLTISGGTDVQSPERCAWR